MTDWTAITNDDLLDGMERLYDTANEADDPFSAETERARALYEGALAEGKRRGIID